jgi:hypothetical protein
MSAPDGIGARRPWRTAGFVLLGLAAASALAGLLTLTTGEKQNPTAEQPAGSAPGSASAAPPAPQTPAPDPAAPAPADPAPAGPAPAGPAPAGPAPGPTAPADPSAPAPGPVVPAPPRDGPPASAGDKGQSRGELRVYNNSTIRGLAARAADDLAAAGWTVVGVGNYSGGRIWTTTVYYQPGSEQRAIAEAVGAQFGMRVEPRFAGIADADPGVIVIVTNDYGA